MTTEDLEAKLAAHRAEKERVKLLKAEIKRQVKKGREATVKGIKERFRKQRIAKIIPAVFSDEETPIVDPAQKELATRVLGRRRLIEFTKQFHSRYLAGWVHHDICARLEKFAADVDAGLSPRLMILMPPRHGKSHLASQAYPAWHLGHYPSHEFIACSYNVDLARKFSRKVRMILRSPRYEKLFPKTKLDPESQSSEEWQLLPTGGGMEAGGYVAAGIGGGITGKGAHVLVIDDPIKNAEEADSSDTREKIWDWYTSTAYTRLAPGGGVLIIQTCWNDDDLSGRIQTAMAEDEGFDQFVVVKYPAIAEEDEAYRVKGEALHPERYSLAQLLQIKKNMDLKGSRWWSALYQQNPVPVEGAFFTKSMFVFRTEQLEGRILNIYQAWDFAISEKRQSDYTVGSTMGVDHENRAHVMEVKRFKSSDGAVIVKEMLDAFERFPRVRGIAVEDGQIWKTLKTLFDAECKRRKLFPAVTTCLPVTDKTVRAGPLQGRMQQGNVTFPPVVDGPGWMTEVMKELLRFPAGIHDDIVDALAWCATLLLGKSPPAAPREPTRKREKTTAEKIRALGRGMGGGAMSA